MLLLAVIPLLVGVGLLLAAASRARRRRRAPAALLLVLGAVCVAAGVGALALTKGYRIPSESMAPTIAVNDRVLLVRTDVGRGDVAVVHQPEGASDPAGPRCGRRVAEMELCPRPAGGRSDITVVKRVVAMGGDRIALRRGRAVVNRRTVPDLEARPCGSAPGCTFRRSIRVPSGHVFVLGDNRAGSVDSRFWGPIPESWVVGRVVARYWPPSRWGAL